jgi:FMN phosphatase YigB (HAD superfamily)
MLPISMKTILVDAFNTFVVEGEGMNKAMFALLDSYPNAKLILTNADDKQLVTLGIVNMPYDVFSLKHNPDKVDSKYFLQMLEAQNLTAKDVIYFEHNVEAVRSAESVGIKTYHYNKDARDLVALKLFLDEYL